MRSGEVIAAGRTDKPAAARVGFGPLRVAGTVLRLAAGAARLITESPDLPGLPRRTIGRALGTGSAMQQSLLDWLVELMKLDYPEDWARLCHHAHATKQALAGDWTRGRRRLRIRDLPTAKDWLDQLANLPSRSPDQAARRCLRSYRRGDPRASTDTLLTDWLCWNCVQRFADVYRNQMVGRIKGTLESKPLDPALITAETLRFDPDELVLDGGELIIVDVRVRACARRGRAGSSGECGRVTGRGPQSRRSRTRCGLGDGRSGSIPPDGREW